MLNRDYSEGRGVVEGASNGCGSWWLIQDDLSWLDRQAREISFVSPGAVSHRGVSAPSSLMGIIDWRLMAADPVEYRYARRIVTGSIGQVTPVTDIVFHSVGHAQFLSKISFAAGRQDKSW